jgi:phosphomevalonate kinase
VGSGFDVSAAIHGSHVYQKQFPPIFYQLMTQLEQNNQEHRAMSVTLARQIQNYVDCDAVDANAATLENVIDNSNDDGKRNVVIAPISLSALGLQLILADVSGGGSESPSMARQVLAWKEQHQQQQQEEERTSTEQGEKNEWDQLKDMNQRIIELLQQLASCASTAAHQEELQALSQLPASDWSSSGVVSSSLLPSCRSLLFELHTAFKATRRALKSMGDKAGVPIEPNVQTELCNATMALPGVVTALVPGAGGYDAIACLYIDHPSVREGILQLWLNWKTDMATMTTDGQSDLRILPLSVQAVGFGEGLRIEKEGTFN